MFRSSSFSFVHELLLEVTPKEEKQLLIRLKKGLQIYNGCLSHCLCLINLIKQSKSYQKAKTPSEKNEVIKDLRNNFGYSEFALHDYIKKLANKGKFTEHLDAFTIQKLATRAYKASEQYFFKKRGKPRFKSFRMMRSVEGKSNKSGIRFKDGKLIWNILKGKALEIKVLFDKKDKYGIEAHALSSKVKYCRILFKEIKGKKLWYLQLILEGKPKLKKKLVEGTVGIDIGPSSIATVGSKKAFLRPFCHELKKNEKSICLLQKKMDRSRRATNPENYNENKTLKKKLSKWKRSSRYCKLQTKLKEGFRKLSQTRKRSHNKLVNELFSYGNLFRLEKLSYRSFQKLYGKSVNRRAPGLFVSSLRRKAESAGGKVEEFSTYRTKLSQTCHCGKREKKKLSQRWHDCSCGVEAQRDLYSAYLAKFVEEENLDTFQAKKNWAVEQPLLERAVSRSEKLASGENNLSSFGLSQRKRLKQRQSQSHVKGESLCIEAEDVVSNLLRASEKCTTCP